MADDPNPNDDESTDAQLGDPGKKALDSERKARRDAERKLNEALTRLKDLEDRDKSEVDKLRDELDAAKKSLVETALSRDRLQVAIDKGLSTAQAKRLVGSTLEELEADAAEILEAFPAKGGATPPPSTRPVPSLSGGTDPTDEPVETNPAKLAEAVPRI